MADLDDKVVKEYHDLFKRIKNIEDADYIDPLKQKLHDNLSKHFDKGELKFKDDEHRRKISDQLWETAADHIAECYIGLDKDEIEKLKAKQPEKEGEETPWERMMSQELGHTKESLYEQLETLEYLKIDQMNEYLKPIHENHLQIRTSRAIGEKIKGPEEAQNAMKYLKLVKKHNPITLKGIKIKDFAKDPKDAQSLYGQVIAKLANNYDPLNKATYEKQHMKK